MANTGRSIPRNRGIVYAIENQEIITKSYMKYIIENPIDASAKCLMCGERNETIDNIIRIVHNGTQHEI